VKAAALDAQRAWNASALKLVAHQFQNGGRDYAAWCKHFEKEVCDRLRAISEGLVEAIDCSEASTQLQAMEEASLLDEHIHSQASRSIDQVKFMLTMRTARVDKDLRERIERLDFEDIDRFLKPFEESEDPLKKRSLWEIWAVIAKQIETTVAENKEKPGVGLVCALRLLERASDLIGERLMNETSVHIDALIDDLKLHCNTVFADRLEDLASALKASDLVAIIRHQHDVMTLRTAWEAMLGSEPQGTAMKLIEKAGCWLEPAKSKLAGFMTSNFDDEFDTTALCADLTQIKALKQDPDEEAEQRADETPSNASKAPDVPRWVVLPSGGVKVQKDPCCDSPKVPAHLGQGAVVRQLSLLSYEGGQCLHFALESGTGPKRGWVTLGTAKAKKLDRIQDYHWKVIGGVGSERHITVRYSQTGWWTTHREGRIGVGAVVRILDQQGNRVHIENLSGSGPDSGWTDMHSRSGACFAPLGRQPAATATASVISVKSVHEFYQYAVAQISEKVNTIYPALGDPRYVPWAVRSLEYLRREFDRGLDQHVEGLRFDVLGSLEIAKQQQQQLNDQFEENLRCRSKVQSDILPQLDRLKSEWLRNSGPSSWQARLSYKDRVDLAKGIFFRTLDDLTAAMDQRNYDRAGILASVGLHMKDVLAEHLSSQDVLERETALVMRAAGCATHFHQDLAVAAINGNVTEYESVFLRYLAFVQYLAKPLPSILDAAASMHQKTFEAVSSRIQHLDAQIADRNFTEVVSTVHVLRNMGRILTGAYAVYQDEIRNRGHRVDEWISRMNDLCSKHFGGTALARYGKFYGLLEVRPNASQEEIKKAYHMKCREHHSDQFARRGEYRDQPDKMQKEVQAAYDELCKEGVCEAYRRGFTEPFSERIRRIPKELERSMGEFLEEEDYAGARGLLTAMRHLPQVAELVEPRLDHAGAVEGVRAILKTCADKLRTRMLACWSKRDLQGLQNVLTSLNRMQETFSAYTDICPSSWMQEVRGDIEKEIERCTEKALAYLDKGEEHALRHMQDLAFELITLGRIFDELPIFKNIAAVKISHVLNHCQEQDWGFAYLFKLGMVLEQGEVGAKDDKGNVMPADQRVAKVIVAHFRHFQDVVTFVWNEQTSATQKDIGSVLQELRSYRATNSQAELDIDRESLRHGFEEYTQEYNQRFHEWRAGQLLRDDIPKRVLAQARGVHVACVADWSRQAKDAIPKILAGIAVYFTILKSGDSYTRLLDAGSGHGQAVRLPNGSTGTKLTTENVLQRPHNIQILTVLRLLGVDSDDKGLRSHLMQIRTGEGKSMILGMLSVIFALFGFKVRCVCYSEYLSTRDYKLFEELFDGFKVKPLVTYSKITAFSEDQVDAQGNIRQLTLDMLRGDLGKPLRDPNGATTDLAPNDPGVAARAPFAPGARGPAGGQHLEEILLVDEVDVFFGPEFYGQTHNQMALLREPAATTILRDIWQYNGKGKSPHDIFEAVKASTPYRQLLKKFPAWSALFEHETLAMSRDLEEFETPRYHYCRRRNRVGYKEMDGMCYERVYGYRTAFAYLNEAAKGNLRDEKEALEHALGVRVPCGHFSYANFVAAAILGVSGTVEALDAREWQVMNGYGVDSYTIMPSVYGRSNFKFMGQQNQNPIQLCDTQEDFFVVITNEVKEKTQNGRAVIVFFETPAILDKYKATAHFRGLPLKNVLSENMSVEDRDYVIKKAATGRQATFSSAVFGRGTDFFCNDRKLQQAGGVHIVQAFFSEQMSEEVQIQGRTARQGHKGTYCMVLMMETLKEVFGVQEAAAKNSPPDQLYQFLCARRQNLNGQKHDEVQRSLKAATERDQLTRKYFCALLQGDARASANMLQEFHTMIKKSSGVKGGCHFTFCLDESGSMAGAPWQSLQTAFNKFLQVRHAAGGDHDLVSVIQFNGAARLTWQCWPLTTAAARDQVLTYSGGGTCFGPALNMAASVLGQGGNGASGLAPVLIFMSDGYNGDGDVTNLLTGLHQSCPDLQLHTIFFGYGPGSDRLQQMASAIPSGQFHLSVDGIQLSETFASIAVGAEFTARK